MTARRQLDEFLGRYSPEVAAAGRAAFLWMRKRYPGATVLVYDNYNALVIGFAAGERASEAAFSIALYPKWVNFFFLNGATLPDPEKRLEGSGNRVRRVRLDNGAATLEEPAVLALIDAEAARSGLAGLPGRGAIEIRAVAAKQRARRALGHNV